MAGDSSHSDDKPVQAHSCSTLSRLKGEQCRRPEKPNAPYASIGNGAKRHKWPPRAAGSAAAVEGWIVDSGGPISTGRFTSIDAADSDGAGPDAGDDGCKDGGSCPPFPSQDFIAPALDLVGLVAVISVEPDPEDSPAPFAIKPLIDTDIEDVAAPATQEMANQSANNPTGAATLE